MRREFARMLRSLIVGNMSNDDYEQQCHELTKRHTVQDAAVEALYNESWFLYDDFKTHTLRGKWELTPEGRSYFARCLLFLRTPHPFRWPVGLQKWFNRNWHRPLHAFDDSPPDDTVWPFWTARDLKAATQSRHLLAAR